RPYRRSRPCLRSSAECGTGRRACDRGTRGLRSRGRRTRRAACAADGTVVRPRLELSSWAAGRRRAGDPPALFVEHGQQLLRETLELAQARCSGDERGEVVRQRRVVGPLDLLDQRDERMGGAAAPVERRRRVVGRDLTTEATFDNAVLAGELAEPAEDLGVVRQLFEPL